MKQTPLKIVYLEDSLQDLELFSKMLTDVGFQLNLTHVDNEKGYREQLEKEHFDIILSDFSLGGFDAFGALEIRQQFCPDTPFICISGSIGEETAIELLKLGAVDYVLKDRPERLPYAVKRALAESEIKQSNRKAAQILQESEEKFRHIFQLHSAIKLLIHPDDGRIVDANTAASLFYGWTIDELKQKTIFEINTLDKDRLSHEINNILSGNKTQFEFIHRRADGSEIDVEVFSNSIPINGEIHLYSIVHDISEKKKILKDLIMAKEKAEESDRLKSAFLNNISHEIRTPLNSILGFGEYLAEADLPIQERMEMYDHLQRSSNRLMNTVNDYVDIALIVSSNLKPNFKNFLVQPFFDDFIARSLQLCDQPDVELIIDTPLEISNMTLNSDKELIKKILSKLLDNAIKFTTQGSITCGYKKCDDYVEFFVKDTGKGIAPEKMELIFKMFSQEESSMTRGYEGSGLGLTISKGLIDLLKGAIQVQSMKGVGSTFSFKIPCNLNQKVEYTKENKVQIIPTEKPVILIAEDDELNFLYMETLFLRTGFEYYHALNGEEAVEFCKKNPKINLIFMDIKMPVMNGIEATKRIRSLKPEIPIIATTAYAQTGDKERFLSEGCNDYLAKPIRKEKFLEIIRKYT